MVAWMEEASKGMKKVVMAVLVVLVVAGAIFLAIIQLGEDSDSQATLELADKRLEKVKNEAIGKRGPRPSQTRLPEGTQQVETTEKALELAKQSLERVENEIASASDDKKVALEKKRELILRAVTRLGQAGTISKPEGK